MKLEVFVCRQTGFAFEVHSDVLAQNLLKSQYDARSTKAWIPARAAQTRMSLGQALHGVQGNAYPKPEIPYIATFKEFRP